MTRHPDPLQDPLLLRSKIDMLERRCVDLEADLTLARQHACRWEQEAKALRKELNAVRQSSTTRTHRKTP